MKFSLQSYDYRPHIKMDIARCGVTGWFALEPRVAAYFFSPVNHLVTPQICQANP